MFFVVKKCELTGVVSRPKGLFVQYGRIPLIRHVEQPNVMEPNNPPCGCLLILKEPLDHWFPELLMSSDSVHEHERKDILPSLGRGIKIDRVWIFLDPVSFCDDAKWEQWSGIKRVVL
jgi:hypothetical protein